MVPIASYVDGHFGAVLLVGVEAQPGSGPVQWTSEVYAFRRQAEGVGGVGQLRRPWLDEFVSPGAGDARGNGVAPCGRPRLA